MSYISQAKALIEQKEYKRVLDLSNEYYSKDELAISDLNKVIKKFTSSELDKETTSNLVSLLDKIGRESNETYSYLGELGFPHVELFDHGFYEECLAVCKLMLAMSECSKNKEFIHLYMGKSYFYLKDNDEAKNHLEIACGDEDLRDEAWKYLKQI